MKKVVGNIGTIYNALTMGERNKAINDGALFERAKDCEFERPLLQGVGQRVQMKRLGLDPGGGGQREWWCVCQNN
jgi:hypothetical protein